MDGMQTFDGVIEKMIRAGQVRKDEGVAYSSNPGNLLLRLSDMGGVGAAQAQAQAQAQKKQDGSGSMLDMIE